MGVISLVCLKHKIDKKGKCGLYARYTHENYGSAYITLGTNFKIDPVYWDFKENIIRKNFGHKKSFEARFANIRTVLETIVQDLELQKRIPEPSLVKDIYQNKEDITKHKMTFWEAYSTFISQGKGERGESTLRNYISFQAKLKAFEGAEVLIKNNKMIRFGTITWDRIDYAFYEMFVSFLIDRGLTSNTLGRNIKYLKTFLSWAKKMKYHSSFEHLEWKATSAEPATFALEDSDLETIMSFTPSSEKLQRIKYLFLLQMALGGLRYGDVISLKRSQFKENGSFLEIKTQKMKRTHIIPVTSEAKMLLQLLDTGEENILKSISLDKYNEYLKVLFKEAGLNRPVTKVRFVGKERKEETKPLYEYISTHAARRTTITMLSQGNNDYKLIGKIAGQSDIKTTMGYSLRPKQDVVDALQEFNTNKIKILSNI